MEQSKGRPALLSQKTMRELVKTQLVEQDTPRSLSIFMIMNHADVTGGFDDEILALELDVSWFLTHTAYIEFAHPTDLVRKSTFLRLTTDPEVEARKRFLQAEQLCADTNRRLSSCYNPKGRLGELIHRVRKNIASLLPEISSELISEQIVPRCGWGSGSTSSSKGAWVSFYHKQIADQHATPAFLPLVGRLLMEEPHWTGKLLPRPYNTVSFVPKNAKTHRAIAVEPSLNAFVQKGVGSLLRDLLKKWGVNLHDQGKNAELARKGSIDGSLATIDLSMASDTIAYQAVKYLLPDEWSIFLEYLRTPGYLDLDGSKQVHPYHKWSSMGNGYTFELETLIFSAVVKSIVNKGDEWAVYGDDIVVPSYALEDLASLLDHLGFLMNTEKSFASGPFRESCGKDYFLGHEVRGFYLKEIKFMTPFVWANWLRLTSPLPFRKTWWRIVEACRHFACFVPYGDHGLVGFFSDPSDLGLDHWLLKTRPYGPVIGFQFSGWRFHPAKMDLREEVLPAMVNANLRFLVAKEATDYSPFAVTARESGMWRRRVNIFTEDAHLLRHV